MPEIQDCNVTFCESFSKVPRELRESWGWDLKGGALSLNYLTFILTLSLSLSLLLSLSQSFTSLCHSLSVSLFLTHSPSLSLTLSLLLSVCLSLALFLFHLLNELVIRHGSAKVSRKYFCFVKLAISGTRNLGQHPCMCMDILYMCIYVYNKVSSKASSNHDGVSCRVTCQVCFRLWRGRCHLREPRRMRISQQAKILFRSLEPLLVEPAYLETPM